MEEGIIPVTIPRRGFWVDRPWDRELERIYKTSRCVPADKNANTNMEATISMASLGKHGGWGNTIYQYAYLKIFAREHGFKVETPDWLGQVLFGHSDPPIKRRYPVVLLDNISKVLDVSTRRSPFDYKASRAKYIVENSGRTVYLINKPLLCDRYISPIPFLSFDLEGLFMIHSKYFRPHKDFFRSLFRPTPFLQEKISPILNHLRSKGKTIIGLHIRLGDFMAPDMLQGFDFVAPFGWYMKWLKEIWPTLEKPILFLCSDEPESVIHYFAGYHPVTSAMLGAVMPDEMRKIRVFEQNRAQKIDFYPDWYLLSHCDCVAISNSTFSYTACMLNEKGRCFLRPSLRELALVPFDPWDSEPLDYLPEYRSIISEIIHDLRIFYEGFGFKVFLRLHTSFLLYFRYLRIRGRACRNINGLGGLLKELLNYHFYLDVIRRYD